MIIEDEPLIAIDIEQMVEGLGHRVTGIARTRDEAIALFRAAKPSMVLADIQLADGSSGIDAVNEILKTSPIPVIFITAFPERLLTGERPEPTFLVTKPFNPEMVKALISQALFFNESTKAAA
jgi:CheY-like chemotaxis protein